MVTWSQRLPVGMESQAGYVVRLFIPGTQREIFIKRVSKESHHILQDMERPDHMIEAYFVQVVLSPNINVHLYFIDLDAHN